MGETGPTGTMNVARNAPIRWRRSLAIASAFSRSSTNSAEPSTITSPWLDRGHAISTGRHISRNSGQRISQRVTNVRPSLNRPRALLADWQRDAKGRALAHHAGDADCAALRLDRLPAEGQPDPRTALPAPPAGMRLAKPIEDLRHVFQWNTQPCVGHLDHYHGARTIGMCSVSLLPSGS